MTPGMSSNFRQAHYESRSFYTYSKKKSNRLSSKSRQTSNSILEVDHYQNALKKGFLNIEKQKALKEKMKVFEKTRKTSSTK